MIVLLGFLGSSVSEVGAAFGGVAMAIVETSAVGRRGWPAGGL
jgi:hypothetical protein